MFLPEHDSQQRHAAPAIIGQGEGSGTDATADPLWEVQPRDKVGVDRGTRGGVVFAYRVAARHEEGVARQRE